MTKEPYRDVDEEVADNPEWTAETTARSKSFKATFPDTAALLERTGSVQKARTTQVVNLRLDKAVVDGFKAGGPGWETRMGEALRKAVGL